MLSKALLALAVFGALAVAANAQTIQSCSSAGVTDQSSCDAQCSGGSCFCQFVELLGTTSCACGNGFSCTSVGTGDDDFLGNLDDEIFNMDDSMDDAVADDDDDLTVDGVIEALVGFLGENCRAAVEASVTEDLFTCGEGNWITDPMTPDTFSASWVSGVCTDKCTTGFANAVEQMSAVAGCLPSITNPTNEVEELLYDLNEIAVRMEFLTPVCTRSSSNGKRCGEMLATLEDMYDNGVTESGCQAVVGYGACVGTFVAALADSATAFADVDTNFNSFNLAALIAGCSAVNNDLATQFAQAAAATEAPTDLGTSSAATVSGVAALVGASLVAAMLA